MAKLSTLDAILYRPPPPGCVLSLMGRPFSGGTILDNSPYGNHGTIAGATWVRLLSGLWVNQFGPVADDFVSFGTPTSFSGMSQLTICLWVNPDNVAQSNNGIIGWEGDSADAFQMMLTGTIGFRTKTTGGTVLLNAITAISKAVWTLLVGVYNGTTMYIYKNAVEDAATAAQTGTIARGAGTSMILGGYYNNGFYMAGKLALARIFNRALSAFEIATIYNQERSLFGV